MLNGRERRAENLRKSKDFIISKLKFRKERKNTGAFLFNRFVTSLKLQHKHEIITHSSHIFNMVL